jgi:hypothetical protein
MVILSVASSVYATPSNQSTKVVKKQKQSNQVKKIVSKKPVIKKPSKKVYKKLTKKSLVKLPPLTLFDYIKDSCRVNCVNHELLLDSVTDASEKLSVDKKMLLAIIRVESSFTVKAKNGRSVGLNQVHLGYHKPKFKGKDYYDVRDNVFVGSTIFSDCFKRSKGNNVKALRCYNGGGDPGYDRKVLERYKEIKALVDLDLPLQLDFVTVVD